MKKEQRLVFLELSSEIKANICQFCKFYVGYPCWDGACKHLLAYIVPSFPGAEDLVPGDDCWGFKPKLNVSDAADIVGVIMANGWRDWRYCIYPNKRIKVLGIKEAQ